MYLKEWIDFHLLAGIEHFYLYDNSTNEDADMVLKKYIEEEKVTHIKWDFNLSGKAPVHPHRTHFLNNYGKETEWVAFIDIDEYIFPLQHNNLKEYFNEKIGNNVSCITIPSTYFGANGVVNYDPLETYKRFTRRMPLNNLWNGAPFFKSIAKISSISSFISAHKVTVSGPTVLECGNVIRQQNKKNKLSKCKIIGNKHLSMEPSYLRLNHYWCRSEEEYYTLRNFQGKRGRNKKNKFISWNNFTNTIEDFKILDYLNKRKELINNLPPKIQERYYKYIENGNISDPLPKLNYGPVNKKRKVRNNSKKNNKI